jgi:hypothetical protein
MLPRDLFGLCDPPAGQVTVVPAPPRRRAKKKGPPVFRPVALHQAEVFGLLQGFPPLTGPPDAAGLILVARTLRVTAAAGGIEPVQNVDVDANHCASDAIRCMC